MVNEVNRLIYNALAEHSSISLPDIGSLRIVRRAAKIEGNRVAPPRFAIEFFSAEEGKSLVDIIATEANISTAEAKDIYLRWLDKVKQGNELIISGVGTLHDKSFVVDGDLSKALNPRSATPLKIHNRRKLPIYIYIAIAIGVVVAVGSNHRADNSTTTTEPKVDVVEKPVVADNIESEQIVEAEPQIVEPIAESTTEELAKDSAQQPARWSDSDDIRHWVVAGSYSTRENAERAVESILSKKQADYCDILPLGKMYAVAVFGSADKIECERFVRDNRHNFKQSWVYTPKRFK